MPFYSLEALVQILERLDLDSMSVQMVLMACAPQQASTHEGLVSMLLEINFVCRLSILLTCYLLLCYSQGPIP